MRSAISSIEQSSGNSRDGFQHHFLLCHAEKYAAMTSDKASCFPRALAHVSEGVSSSRHCSR